MEKLPFGTYETVPFPAFRNKYNPNMTAPLSTGVTNKTGSDPIIQVGAILFVHF